MTTPIKICRGCTRPIISLLNPSQTLISSTRAAKNPRGLQSKFARTNHRTFTTTKTRAAISKQSPSRVTAGGPKPPDAPSSIPSGTPLLSYAQKLAVKTSPTTLYEAAPQKVFLFSSYTAGLFCLGAAAVNVWVNVYNLPDGIHPAVPVAFGAVGMVIAAFGTRFALMPAGAIRSIKILPARSLRATRVAQQTAIPVQLEIEARSSLPFPGLPLKRIQVDPYDVVMKAPMYNRKAAPSEYEKMLMRREQEAQRKKDREYEMNHLMTAPFRHGGQAISILFSNIRRGLTGEGFAPVTIKGVKYKLDITSAYALEEGRALDRIVKIEQDPAIARLAAQRKQ
ncbi:hypothetical protein M426DRAFT_7342 [Hypoxylon sp. CI-4A]|nr:hypothetical protein M426DRAFT_7342 [Hypoxylon sp. CI-4A]